MVIQPNITVVRRLPSGFQRVEWIGTDGNQYIDTNIVPEISKVKCSLYNNSHSATIYAYSAGTGTYQFFFGTEGSSRSWTKFFDASANGSYWMGTNYFVSYTANSDGREEFIYEPTGETKNFSVHVGTAKGTVNTTLNLFRKADGTSYFKGRMKYFILDGQLELYPCYRKSDSVIGMFDTVNGTFYTNQGTGTFTKGADIY